MWLCCSAAALALLIRRNHSLCEARLRFPMGSQSRRLVGSLFLAGSCGTSPRGTWTQPSRKVPLLDAAISKDRIQTSHLLTSQKTPGILSASASPSSAAASVAAANHAYVLLILGALTVLFPAAREVDSSSGSLSGLSTPDDLNPPPPPTLSSSLQRLHPFAVRGPKRSPVAAALAVRWGCERCREDLRQPPIRHRQQIRIHEVLLMFFFFFSSSFLFFCFFFFFFSFFSSSFSFSFFFVVVFFFFFFFSFSFSFFFFCCCCCCCSTGHPMILRARVRCLTSPRPARAA